MKSLARQPDRRKRGTFPATVYQRAQRNHKHDRPHTKLLVNDTSKWTSTFSWSWANDQTKILQ
jgi:hypothetical protein